MCQRPSQQQHSASESSRASPSHCSVPQYCNVSVPAHPRPQDECPPEVDSGATVVNGLEDS